MESLIHAFGIDLKLITIQIINFVVLAGALSYFLYKPILRILNEREEKIKQGVSDAAAAATARNEAESERKSILAEAQQKASEVSKRAEEHAKERAAEVEAAADAEVARRLRLADEKAEALAEEARKKSEAGLAEVAVLAAEKILREGK